MTERPVAWIGIDAGKAAHHAVTVDEAGRVCWSQRVPNDEAAIGELIARAAGTAAEVRWAVDLTGSAAALLLAVLIAAVQKVAYVPGRMVNRMAGMFPARGRLTPRMRGLSLRPPGCARTWLSSRRRRS